MSTTLNSQPAAASESQVNLPRFGSIQSCAVKQSVCHDIGFDLLKLSGSDSVQAIRLKVLAAIAEHPEHLFEIAMVGMLSVVDSSETKNEVLDFINETLSHANCCDC